MAFVQKHHFIIDAEDYYPISAIYINIVWSYSISLLIMFIELTLSKL